MADILEVTLLNQDLPALEVSITDFSSFTTAGFVTESISAHNVSPISHLDIRAIIDDLNSCSASALSAATYELSSYINEVSSIITSSLELTAETLSNELSTLEASAQYLFDNKIDKPLSTVSGNVAIFNNSRNVIDSGINSSRITILDLSGLVPQRNIPEVYIRNIAGGDIYHPLVIETNIYGEYQIIVGVGVPLSSL